METASCYYRARYYDPAAGRFLSEDYIGFAGGDIDLYTYTFNAPTNFFDPTGFDGWTRVWGGVRAVGGGLEAASGFGLAVTTSWTGVGAVAGTAVGLHGLDQVQAGLRQLIGGCKTDSLTVKGLKKAGLSSSAANAVDAGISVVGSMGTGIATQAAKAVWYSKYFLLRSRSEHYVRI